MLIIPSGIIFKIINVIIRVILANVNAYFEIFGINVFYTTDLDISNIIKAYSREFERCYHVFGCEVYIGN